MLKINEQELIENKIAKIRDNLFDEYDYLSDEGYDLLPSYAGSPYEVLCGIEQKIIRQQKDIKNLEHDRRIAEDWWRHEADLVDKLTRE